MRWPTFDGTIYAASAAAGAAFMAFGEWRGFLGLLIVALVRCFESWLERDESREKAFDVQRIERIESELKNINMAINLKNMHR